MWMVGGYNESSYHHHHHHQVNLDAFNGGRKLRPLIPRPPVVSSATTCTSSTTTHPCNFGHYTGVGGDQGISHNNIINNKEQVNYINTNGGGGGGQQVGIVSTSRWNPTPEQLRTLEELYRRGTRTPSTDQIQRITADLRWYGKIEGKNVFYWFQNHEARERQKRRRELKLLSSHDDDLNHNPHPDDDDPIIARKERGPASGKQDFEGEQTRSHYSVIASAAAEECGAMSFQRAADHRSTRHINIGAGACSLFQLDDERNATWHNLAPSSSPLFFYSPSLITCITSTTTTTTTTDGGVTPKTRRFIASLKESIRNSTSREREEEGYEDEGEDSATLQLFPLRSQVESSEEEEEDQDKSKERDVHFFEFLPPKSD